MCLGSLLGFSLALAIALALEIAIAFAIAIALARHRPDLTMGEPGRYSSYKRVTRLAFAARLPARERRPPARPIAPRFLMLLTPSYR